MRVTLPRPIHGWRAFVGEVGIIVLGVLIALSAGEIVDTLRWARQLEQADTRFQTELGPPVSSAYEHLSIEKCLNDRLIQIGSKLLGVSPSWQGMPETLNDRGLPWKIGREDIPLPFHGKPAIMQPIVTEGWNNALSDGTISHLPATKAGTLAQAYAAARRLQSSEQEQAEEAAKLAPLGSDRPLSADSRAAMISTVVNLRRIDGDIARNSEDVILAVEQTGLGFDGKSIHKDNAVLLSFDRTVRGACVVQPKLPHVPTDS